MSSRRAHRNRHFLGFGVSVLLHLGLLAAVLGWVRTTGEAAGEGGGRPVAINLAMFQSSSPQETADVSPAEQPLEDAEPLPDPVPVTPAQSQQEIPPEPEPVEQSETAPEPSAEPKAPLEAQPVAKPKPKPQPQQKPKAAPKPKPKSRPAAKPESKSPATAQAPAAARAKATTPAADGAGDKTDTGAKGPPAPDKAAVAALERQYLEGLRRAIESHKFYPKRARRRGDEGQVLVAFVVQRDGRITGVEVRRSSGSKLLDKAAAEALEKLARYRPIPEALQRQRWPLRVPINFALD